MIDSFLSSTDAHRATRTFEMLSLHDTSKWVLTGGFAVELHLFESRAESASRPLNDIDFVVDRFEAIPATLSSDLIFRHVHPNDSANKTLVQSVFPQTAVRIDIFRCANSLFDRSVEVQIAGRTLRMISIEDLTARSARLSMDLDENQPMPAKHARDLLRLLPSVAKSKMQTAWADHRKPRHPATFREAAELLQRLIPARTDLQVVPVYSRDYTSICARCERTLSFPLADPETIYALLGYC
jgi:hypothetical protein